MWLALKELFGGLSAQGRFWLAVVIVLAVVAIFITMILTGVDAAPLWGLLGS
jgi:hypothetical protein